MTDETPVAEAHGRRTRWEMLTWSFAGGAAIFAATQGMNIIVQTIAGTVWGVTTLYLLVSFARWQSARKRRR